MEKTTAPNTTISQKMLKIGRMGWEYTRDRLADPKLSNVQYRVCSVIYSDPGLSQDEVAKALGMDKSSVAKLVFKMMELNFICREVNPKDRRQYCLYLTEEGAAKTEEFLDLLNQWEKSMFDSIGEGVFDECQKNLNMVIQLAEKYMDEDSE